MKKDKGKRGQRRQRARLNIPQAKTGLDLGVRRRVMFFSEADLEFNNALRATGSAGCAYGGQQVQDFFAPAISMLGSNAEGFRKAFDVFRRWGCEVDGDVIEVTILMKRAGGYFLIVGPDMERFLQRMSPDYDLVEPLAVGLQWIKPIDTTNPFLLQLQKYAKGRFAPIVFGAGTVKVVNGLPAGGPEDVEFIDGLPEVIIYNMKIIHEDEEPDHWVLKRGDKKYKGAKGGPENRKPRPSDIANYRRRTIDQAFPVTRERVKRAKLFDEVLADQEFSGVTVEQVAQAAINLLLSRELADGRPHFEGLTAAEETVWDYILTRYERADGKDPVPQLDLGQVKEQIRLDVKALLTSQGVPTTANFGKLQKEILRRGYA